VKEKLEKQRAAAISGNDLNFEQEALSVPKIRNGQIKDSIWAEVDSGCNIKPELTMSKGFSINWSMACENFNSVGLCNGKEELTLWKDNDGPISLGYHDKINSFEKEIAILHKINKDFDAYWASHNSHHTRLPEILISCVQYATGIAEELKQGKSTSKDIEVQVSKIIKEEVTAMKIHPAKFGYVSSKIKLVTKSIRDTALLWQAKVHQSEAKVREQVKLRKKWQDKNQILRLELKRLKQTHFEVEKELRSKTKAVERKVRELEDRNKELNMSNEKLYQSKEQLTFEIERINTIIQKSTIDKENLQAEVTKLTTTKKEAQEDYRSRIEVLQNQVKRHKLSNEDTIRKLRAEEKILTAKHEEANEKFQAQSMEVKRLETIIQLKDKQLSLVSDRIKSFDLKEIELHSKYRNQTSSLHQTISHMKQKLTSQKQELEFIKQRKTSEEAMLRKELARVNAQLVKMSDCFSIIDSQLQELTTELKGRLRISSNDLSVRETSGSKRLHCQLNTMEANLLRIKVSKKTDSRGKKPEAQISQLERANTRSEDLTLTLPKLTSIATEREKQLLDEELQLLSDRLLAKENQITTLLHNAEESKYLKKHNSDLKDQIKNMNERLLEANVVANSRSGEETVHNIQLRLLGEKYDIEKLYENAKKDADELKRALEQKRKAFEKAGKKANRVRSALSEEVNQLRMKVTELSKKLETFRVSDLETKSKIEENEKVLLAKEEALCKALRDLEIKREDALTKEALYESNIATLSVRVKNSDSELKVVKETNRKLKDEIVTLGEKIELKNKEMIQTVPKSCLEKSSKEQIRLQTEVESLQEQNLILEKRILKLNSKNNIKRLQLSLRQMKSERNKLRLDKEAVERKLQSQKTQHSLEISDIEATFQEKLKNFKESECLSIQLVEKIKQDHKNEIAKLTQLQVIKEQEYLEKQAEAETQIMRL